MSTTTPRLRMYTYLLTVRDQRWSAWRTLQDLGYPTKVIAATADKAARRGYTDYGVSPVFAWIEGKGERFLETRRVF